LLTTGLTDCRGSTQGTPTGGRATELGVAHEYVDHAISGSKGRDKHPAFNQLCKDATAGKFDLIAAWSFDRLGRSVLHPAEFVEDMRSCAQQEDDSLPLACR
jgi:DNA invertase Pin-like site-specific DNA recombinase